MIRPTKPQPLLFTRLPHYQKKHASSFKSIRTRLFFESWRRTYLEQEEQPLLIFTTLSAIMTTLITHSASACSDNFSLFGKDKSFYGLPGVVKSRSSIPRSDVSSLLGKARSFAELHEVSIVTTRNSLNLVERPATQQGSQLSQPPTLLVDGQYIDADDLEDYEDDVPAESQTNVETPETASFVTARMSAYENAALPRSKPTEKNPYVFHRWMKSMLKRSSSRGKTTEKGELFPPSRDGSMISGGRTMGSSSRFVTAIRTASVTLASFPMSSNTAAPRSSGCGPLDKDTIGRMLDRKNALEELITTEEYYIKDLRSLKDVCGVCTPE